MSELIAKKSLDELLAKAEAGETGAQGSLAMLHELGLIKGASLQEAVRWYSAAARAGNPEAALALGRLFEMGSPDLPSDPKLAENYFLLAEKQGFRCKEKRFAEISRPRSKLLLKDLPVILILDDSPTFRAVTRVLLQKNNFQVIEASDAQQALRLLQSKAHIDLILSDVEMPGIDGIKFVELVRQKLKLKNLPVVMLSSVRNVEVLKKAAALGIQGWLLKPTDPDALIATIKKGLVFGSAA